MADRPILFSSPMVRALLAGTKTQTRRVFKGMEQFASGDWHIFNAGGGMINVREENVPAVAVDYVPYAVGDRLWVREAWRTLGAAGMADNIPPRDLFPQALWYEADGTAPLDLFVGKLRPGMFMPRWASRLTLTLTDVRIQRLQEITEADAEAEGMGEPYLGDGDPPFEEQAIIVSRRMQFRNLWNRLNAKRAPWDANPWIVAVSFTVQHGNIDQPRPAVEDAP